MEQTDDRGSVAAGESIGTDFTPEEIATAIGLDEQDIQWRKEFVGFDDGDAERVAALRGVVEEKEEALVDAFLDPIYNTEETASITDRSPRDNEALRAIVSGYYRTLTGGEYGREYFKHRTRIGQLHDKLEMPLHYFTGMFANVTNVVAGELMDQLAETAREELDDEDAARMVEEIEATERTLASGVRLLNLDMQVVNDTYLHSFTSELMDEIEQSQQMRETVGESVAESRESFERVTDNVEQLQDIAGSFEHETEEVATEVSDVSAVIEEIAASSEQARENSEEASDLAETGKERASESVEAIEDVDDARDDLAEQVDDLVDAVDEVNQIVDAINDIADQTNMLALNASIEAARAGEAGSGFAVVADEVKSLAEQTREEAGRVEDLLTGVTADIDDAAAILDRVDERVEEGRTNIEATDEALSDIRERVDETQDSISEVATATDEQAASASEVAALVDELSGHADDISSEVAAVAQEIETQAAGLRDIETATDQLRDANDVDFGNIADAGDWTGPTYRTERSLNAGKKTADGGFVVDTAQSGDDASRPPAGVPADLYERLPDGMPDSVLASLDRETLESIADGDVDAGDAPF